MLSSTIFMFLSFTTTVMAILLIAKARFKIKSLHRTIELSHSKQDQLNEVIKSYQELAKDYRAVEEEIKKRYLDYLSTHGYIGDESTELSTIFTPKNIELISKDLLRIIKRQKHELDNLHLTIDNMKKDNKSDKMIWQKEIDQTNKEKDELKEQLFPYLFPKIDQHDITKPFTVMGNLYYLDSVDKVEYKCHLVGQDEHNRPIHTKLMAHKVEPFIKIKLEPSTIISVGS